MKIKILMLAILLKKWSKWLSGFKDVIITQTLGFEKCGNGEPGVKIRGKRHHNFKKKLLP